MDKNNPEPEDDVMCHCSGTRRSMIKNQFELGKDIQAISDWTGALTGCGGCEWDIADFLKALAEQPSQTPAFEVWRLDDNGNEFLVARYDDREVAERKIAELAAGGHKQTYWIK